MHFSFTNSHQNYALFFCGVVVEHRGNRPGVIFVVNFCFVNCHQFYIGDNYKDGDEIGEVVENRGHRPMMLNAILFLQIVIFAVIDLE